MADLERFGFDLPEQRARGKEKVGKSDVEVHRGGPNEFLIVRTMKDGKRREDRARVEDVQELWTCIEGILSGSATLTEEQVLSPEPVLSARQIMRRLWERMPRDRYPGNIDISAWQGGENRAAVYFPRYYNPLLVLDLYFRAVERRGRNIKVLRMRPALGESVLASPVPQTGVLKEGEWGRDTVEG